MRPNLSFNHLALTLTALGATALVGCGEAAVSATPPAAPNAAVSVQPAPSIWSHYDLLGR